MDIDAGRLRVKWDKGRNYFLSFFSELTEVQKSMDREAFAQWCIQELHLSLGIIWNASNVLKAIDTKITKEAFASSRKADQERKLLEKIAKSREKIRLIAEKKVTEKKKRKQLADRRYRERKKARIKALQLAAE
jgi:hypothetical protein